MSNSTGINYESSQILLSIIVLNINYILPGILTFHAAFLISVLDKFLVNGNFESRQTCYNNDRSENIFKIFKCSKKKKKNQN